MQALIACEKLNAQNDIGPYPTAVKPGSKPAQAQSEGGGDAEMRDPESPQPESEECSEQEVASEPSSSRAPGKRGTARKKRQSRGVQKQSGTGRTRSGFIGRCLGMGPSKQGQETNCLVAGAWTDAHSLNGQLEARMPQHLHFLRH